MRRFCSSSCSEQRVASALSHQSGPVVDTSRGRGRGRGSRPINQGQRSPANDYYGAATGQRQNGSVRPSHQESLRSTLVGEQSQSTPPQLQYRNYNSVPPPANLNAPSRGRGEFRGRGRGNHGTFNPNVAMRGGFALRGRGVFPGRGNFNSQDGNANDIPSEPRNGPSRRPRGRGGFRGSSRGDHSTS